MSQDQALLSDVQAQCIWSQRARGLYATNLSQYDEGWNAALKTIAEFIESLPKPTAPTSPARE